MESFLQVLQQLAIAPMAVYKECGCLEHCVRSLQKKLNVDLKIKSLE